MTDEQAVRAAMPNAYRRGKGWGIWDSYTSFAMFITRLVRSVDVVSAPGFLGHNWTEAREHPTVKAWEAAANYRPGDGT